MIDSRTCCHRLDDLLSERLFKALSDPNRLALFVRLATCGQSCTVGELAECLTVDVSVVSRHLAMLRDAGVLEAEKQGKQVFYRVRYAPIVEALRAMADAIDACCGEQGCCQPAEAREPAQEIQNASFFKTAGKE